jgi:mRNA-degrading endonuclease toxin of MazEF toxin-antitoxin module
VVLAEITTNQAAVNDPGFVLIDTTTPDGKATGLDQDSLVSALFLSTVYGDRIDQVLGTMSAALMEEVDAALTVALPLA